MRYYCAHEQVKNRSWLANHLVLFSSAQFLPGHELFDLTARVLKHGQETLGVETVEQMFLCICQVQRLPYGGEKGGGSRKQRA